MLKNFIKTTNIHNVIPYIDGISSILLLHRVVSHKKKHVLDDLEISSNELSCWLGSLRNEGYTFISLDELIGNLKNGKKTKKTIVVTLDDGYKDNYANAKPIFESLNIPYTIYICTDFPDLKIDLWWHKLALLVEHNGSIDYEAERARLLNMSGDDRMGYFDKKQISLNLAELCLSWDEIIEMSKTSLCTIGAHTVTHSVLANCTLEDARFEIMQSRTRLEEKIGKKVEHFAYPFGSKGTSGVREGKLVEELGFKSAVTTRSGNIFKEHMDNLFALPRIPVTGSDMVWNDVLISGFISFIRNRGKMVVTW